MNLKKKRYSFSHKNMIYKNLPQILHIYLRLGESKTSLDPSFSEFWEANNSTEIDGKDDRIINKFCGCSFNLIPYVSGMKILSI
jgi:hypothetical protein